MSFTVESECPECGIAIFQHEKTEPTFTAEAKERELVDAPTDHDCEFTEHTELDEPVTGDA